MYGKNENDRGSRTQFCIIDRLRDKIIPKKLGVGIINSIIKSF